MLNNFIALIFLIQITGEKGKEKVKLIEAPKEIKSVKKVENIKEVKEITEGEKEIRDIEERRGDGEINWTQGVIRAEGRGVMDTSLPYAQAKAMAVRAAVVDAQRNLLEIVKGVYITSETTVENAMLKNDVIKTKVEGVIKNARMVGEPQIEGNLVKVVMEIPLYDTGGIAPVFKEPEETEEKVKIKTPEKIAIVVKGEEYKPVIFPKVVDEEGKTVLNFKEIYNPKTGKFVKFGRVDEKYLEKLKKKGYKIIMAEKGEIGKIYIPKKYEKTVSRLKKIGKAVWDIGKFLLLVMS
ncbi:hypothetical protein DRN73_09990 [Candidatus Pacearchaeota archaeon]|nr:MAG: hypothetical protein DRN73_09990 [Candidatus Pacearchaeota archaeon]